MFKALKIQAVNHTLVVVQPALLKANVKWILKQLLRQPR